ncbi:MAG TPA: aldo/keto reductase [Myxococcota bacterium]|nr:aldo/keto reductase [Myxococcota bacterium]HQK50534.1 aldo/keto reductase [Myxococcota bacterium]
MRRRRLGSTDWQVSAMAVGTWAMGGVDFGRVDDRDSVKAIHRAMDLGINLFDTAPIYGSGRSEEVLGKALRGIRGEVLVATKCGPVEPRPGLVRMDCSPEGIEAQVEASLRRLRTDWIDLLQLHWPDPAWPIEGAVEAMDRLRRAGLVRELGVSNTSADELRRALGAGPVKTLQPRYNLLERDFEKELLPLTRERDLGVLVYEPLARGLLSGRMETTRRFDPGDVRLADPRFRGEAFRRNLERVERLRQVAGRHGLTCLQAAIAWVLSQGDHLVALCGAKTALQVVENARAAEIDLDPATAEEFAAAVE